MEELSVKDILQAVGGTLINNDSNDFSGKISVLGVGTDSRKIKTGEVFIALNGLNMDGHEYVDIAYKNGAILSIVSRKIDSNIPQIIVEDTYLALKSLAEYYRTLFDISIIAVTGSTGKTSTKEMIGAVLEQKFNVHKTRMNFNNEIGLPLTVFEMNRENEVSILEMGMNNLGEIKALTQIARPTIGVITNIGSAHIENLGSKENILKAKMEMTTYFNENSLLIINSDDEFLSRIEKDKYDIIKISMNNNGDYNAFDIVNLGGNGVEFSCYYKKVVNKFKINSPGKHNVYNALCAIAIGEIFNMEVETIKLGIENYKSVGQRMNIINMEQDIKIINDCYNANPDSMKAALDVLVTFEDRRRIALLGDMLELGSYSVEAHEQIGNYLKDKCDILISVGNEAIHMYNKAKKYVDAHYFRTKDEAKDYISSIIKAGDVILIKASRGMKMENITNYLLEDRKKGL